MARWRLMSAHYLQVPGTEWEYKETDRVSGKQGRKVYIVPAYLNPNDAPDHNYPGEIIVCHSGKGQSRDIEFIGPPTPDMEPLDDEATALSDAMRPLWNHPINSLPGQGFSDSLLASFEKQLTEIMNKSAKPIIGGVDPTAFAELQVQVQVLMARNAELESRGRRA